MCAGLGCYSYYGYGYVKDRIQAVKAERSVHALMKACIEQNTSQADRTFIKDTYWDKYSADDLRKREPLIDKYLVVYANSQKTDITASMRKTLGLVLSDIARDEWKREETIKMVQKSGVDSNEPNVVK